MPVEFRVAGAKIVFIALLAVTCTWIITMNLNYDERVETPQVSLKSGK